MSIKVRIRNLDAITSWEERVDDNIRKANSILVEEILDERNHPFQTGFARASWYTSLDRSPSAHPNQPTKSAGSVPQTLSVRADHIFDSPGKRFEINNSADYILELETRPQSSVRTGRAGWIRSATQKAYNYLQSARI